MTKRQYYSQHGISSEQPKNGRWLQTTKNSGIIFFCPYDGGTIAVPFKDIKNGRAHVKHNDHEDCKIDRDILFLNYKEVRAKDDATNT